MRVIKPYGVSRTEQPEAKRFLYDSSANRAKHDISVFASTNPDLVLAQWISVIDKIATKPQGTKRATQKQKMLRQKLGEAAWKRLMADGRITALGDDLDRVRALWWFKIHPYGDLVCRHQIDREPSEQGRWYKTFVGEATIDNLDADKVANDISDHLYKSEFRLGDSLPRKQKGLIEARAKSISGNILKEHEVHEVSWDDTHIADYIACGDVAHAIYTQVLQCEQNDKKHVRLEIAAKCLFAHWAKVFSDPVTGKPLGIQAAKDTKPELFELHMAVKETYTRILKNHNKNTKDHRKLNPNNRRISSILPKNTRELIDLQNKQSTNSDLNYLVRLGKVLHYSMLSGGADSTLSVAQATNWPDHLHGSYFWASDGQSEIKRAEAFVRVWRGTLAYAGITLKSWASMKKPIQGDVLGSETMVVPAVKGDNFDRAMFDNKFKLLYGNSADAILSSASDDDCKSILRTSIDAARTLRNKAFHFTGRKSFLDGLEGLGGQCNGDALRIVRNFWNTDATNHGVSIKAQLIAVQSDRFYNDRQNQSILDVVLKSDCSDLPLPRFSRLLVRADNTKRGREDFALPAPVNRTELENPARLCQYTILKLIYDKAFSTWLEKQNSTAIVAWIDKAVERTTQAAKSINGKKSEEARKMIAARASVLPKPAAGSDIKAFFFDLASSTASEMRVQRGYESDPDKAKEQAEYIDDLLCDVLILAFKDFIAQHSMQWLLGLSAQAIPSPTPLSDISNLPIPAVDVAAEDWQVVLYFILHLIPVEEVNKLIHQMNKWTITSSRDNIIPDDEKDRLQKLQRVMSLYLDMHDQKFEGGSSIEVGRAFRDLFESDDGFNNVFPSQDDCQSKERIPQRGLREILRFGHLPLIAHIGANNHILDKDITAVKAMEDGIVGWQQRRETLHEKWVSDKTLNADDLKSYCEALGHVVRHRHAVTQIYLTNHLRAYRLMMSVLSRLQDYAGLFERDLYFVTIAVLYNNRMTLPQFLKLDGRIALETGQIIKALDESNNDPIAIQIKAEIARHFGQVWVKGNSNRDTRNHLSHFNMLHGMPHINLTDWINKARGLMGYDRKLKNAVTQSIIELLGREGIVLRWEMNANHALENAVLETRYASHLGIQKLSTSYGSNKPIQEALHGDGYVKMIGDLFAGTMKIAVDDITGLNLSQIDWRTSTQGRLTKKNGNTGHKYKPQKDEKFYKKRRIVK